jgi:molecular chaperone DnaJ
VTLYQVLGVDASVNGAELTRAYHRRLRQLHPDVRPAPVTDHHADPAADPVADLAAVQHAYQVLRDPDRRAHYDAELRAREPGTRVDARRWSGAQVSITVRVHRPRPSAGPLVRVGRVRIDPLPPP